MENSPKEEIVVHDEEVQQLFQSLEKVSTNVSVPLMKYQGFFYPSDTCLLKNILMFQRHFRARNTDIIITSPPKTGSTWLKSLLFATVNRFHHPKHESPLLKHHPVELVYRLEDGVYGEAFEYPRPHHLKELPSPRLLHTHLPYTSLPESIASTDPGCRILYISRNPLDTLVSHYYFLLDTMKMRKGDEFKPPSLEDFFEDFYDGRSMFGPFFEHVLGYWKLSLEQPDRVLFWKYENLKADPTSHILKLAEFAGVPFSPQEESEGVIQEIIQMCSFKNLKELEVNKTGTFNKWFEKKSFFRKGEVGDGIRHFPPSMVERMTKLVQQKFEGTGLSL